METSNDNTFYRELIEKIDNLSNKMVEMENDIEHYFYMFLSFRASKKYIEEIVEIACVEYFNTTLKDIYSVPKKRKGRPRPDSKDDQLYEECTGWIIAISIYILLKNSHTLDVGYPFYNRNKEVKWGGIIEGAINPVTKQDKENRKTLLAISKIIKDMMKLHGIEDRRFDSLTS